MHDDTFERAKVNSQKKRESIKYEDRGMLLLDGRCPQQRPGTHRGRVLEVVQRRPREVGKSKAGIGLIADSR